MALRIAKCKRCALFYEKRGFCAHFGPKITGRLRGTFSVFLSPLWTLMSLRFLTSLTYGTLKRSVGDEVAAIAGHDTVLAHTHLVLDGYTANGASTIHQRVEMGVAARAHRIKVVGTD